MRLEEFRPGMSARVNASGDLGIVREMRRIIGQPVKAVSQAKSGLIVVVYEGKEYRVPLRNLDPG